MVDGPEAGPPTGPDEGATVHRLPVGGAGGGAVDDVPFDDEEFDLEDEAFLAAWEEAEHEAAELVAEALAAAAPPRPDDRTVAAAAAALRTAHHQGQHAAGWMLRAAGIDSPEDEDDEDLLCEAVAATIAMVADPGLPAEEAAAIMTLELADWAGAVIGLVRSGPGAPADPGALVAYAEEVEEVDAEPLDADDRETIEFGFLLVLPAWEAAGVVTGGFDDARLTPLGAWLLPQAVQLAWRGDADLDLEDADLADLVELLDPRGSWEGWRERLGDADLAELFDDGGDAELDPEVRDTAVRVLSADGPMAEEDLLDRLVADGTIGADDRDAVAASLWELPRLMPVRDGRLVHLPSLAEGRTFTHRMTGPELADGRIASAPDLSLYEAFLPPLVHASGQEVVLRDWQDADDPDRATSLFGPEGWLPEGLEPDDLVACRIEDGRLTVTRIDASDLDAAAGERAADHLRTTFEALDGRNVAGGPVDEPELLVEAVVRSPTLFRRPVAPVAELLAEAGLAREPAAGVFDPESVPEPPPYGFYEAAYGLDETGTDAVGILSGAVDLIEREGLDVLPDDLAGNLLEMLALDPAVAEALADSLLGILGTGAEALDRFGQLLLPHARGRRAAPVHLLAARAAEAHGDALAGEAALRRAVQADPACAPAHEDLAWYLDDRGDVAGALRHLHQAGIADDDPQVQRLTARQAQRPRAGRNDPCPCGSGTKFKRCCERTGGPLPDRVEALFDKARAYVNRPLHRAELLGLVEARAGDAADEGAMVRSLSDGLLHDVALFEDGWLEDFLADRGPLLPADESELVRAWLDVPRSLFEVVGTTPGDGLQLLDLRSGDRVDVREHAASRRLTVGTALFARVVPDGQGHQLSGGVLPIAVPHREQLLGFLGTAPSAAAMCAWVAALEAPPALRTTEGEPTVLCEATYRVADPVQAAHVLTERYDADEDGQRFVEWVEGDGRRWLRGTIELDGERLHVQTNAEPRLERIKAVVEAEVAGAELLDEVRRPAAELVATGGRGDDDAAGDADGDGSSSLGSAALGRSSAPPSLDELPEEVRAALEAEIRRHEEAWVDESIPMFGGLTPREALEDPTRRGQVLAFLDEVEATAVPGGMDAGRIRRLLGLTGP
jgi:hypothetical protein